jgi:hypothetical protein
MYAKALAELEARWGNLRAGSKQLTKREAQELAAPIYDLWVGNIGTTRVRILGVFAQLCGRSSFASCLPLALGCGGPAIGHAVDQFLDCAGLCDT